MALLPPSVRTTIGSDGFRHYPRDFSFRSDATRQTHPVTPYSWTMSDYRPPLRDIRFVLENIVDLKELSALPGFEHVEAEDVYDALAEAGRFLSEVVAPTNHIGDTTGIARSDDGSVTVPAEMVAAYRQLVEAGWPAIKGDPEYGGHGFPGVMATACPGDADRLQHGVLAMSRC